MANIKSQIKRNRQTLKRRARNRALSSELKTRIRHTLEAAEAGNAEQAHDLLRGAQQRIDTAAARGVLHRNAAARQKSRLASRVRRLLES